MTAPGAVLELVGRFERNLAAYKRGHYNETQVRREFIDPLFGALGWDVANVKGYAERYKDVVHEDAVKVGGGTKAPDYGFRIGGVRKFFVEAKKPSVDIKDDVHPAYQLRRYAWSAKLPLSILTDFEEFAVYDCRMRPVKSDKSSTARVMYLEYGEYPQRWDEIADVFSREAILTGSFDRYVESKRAKRGTAEVDAAFLAEIERWRDLLARNIALRNPNLSQRQLNFAVQHTIDRIIFLRIAEDRGIEPYGTLLGLVNGQEVYARLMLRFRHADARYNSGLFHFEAERDRTEAPDRLTPGLAVDDKVLRDILKHLYYPDSPYEFSVLPADILGQVYEQFLGKVIRLTPAHRAVVENKPEVKKAGGVFYTPSYIVDYIVEQTVGKLVQGKRPGPRGGVSRLRILDPACGSGSFLIGAYQFLLDWHLEQYVADGSEQWATGATPRVYQSRGGEWQLTIDERKRILLNNIYGVDIDPQAVEVTKLSLLLKVLEGEDEQTLGQQLALFPERVLPDLSRNIKCGNSLIGPDFYQGRQLSLLDEDEALRINAFDWEAEFPEVFPPSPLTPLPKGEGDRRLPSPAGRGAGGEGRGGFDAVIGNPPYVRIQHMKQWAPVEVEYYKERYRAASKGNYDIYVVFVEKGLSLLNERGRLGFILPHKFFNAKYGEPLRGLIAEGQHLADV
ncbi:MAG: Eco57I restriction-modification methylase domain-containing protein, partial [Anaerolineae bacterium]